VPAAQTLGELGAAVGRVLEDASFREAAGRLCDAMRVLPPVDAAVDMLAAIAGRRAPVG